MAKQVPAHAETICSPAGFVEQKYYGRQTPASLKIAFKQLTRCAQAMQKKGKPVLVLLDATELIQSDNHEAHLLKVKILAELKFKRAAIYGPLSVQVLINTLAMVAGVTQKTRAFSTREEAIKWLHAK